MSPAMLKPCRPKADDATVPMTARERRVLRRELSDAFVRLAMAGGVMLGLLWAMNRPEAPAACSAGGRAGDAIGECVGESLAASLMPYAIAMGVAALGCGVLAVLVLRALPGGRRGGDTPRAGGGGPQPGIRDSAEVAAERSCLVTGSGPRPGGRCAPLVACSRTLQALPLLARRSSDAGGLTGSSCSSKARLAGRVRIPLGNAEVGVSRRRSAEGQPRRTPSS